MVGVVWWGGARGARQTSEARQALYGVGGVRHRALGDIDAAADVIVGAVVGRVARWRHALGCDRVAGQGFGVRGATLIELAEGGDELGAGIGVRKGARLAPRSGPAIEDMRADQIGRAHV